MYTCAYITIHVHKKDKRFIVECSPTGLPEGQTSKRRVSCVYLRIFFSPDKFVIFFSFLYFRKKKSYQAIIRIGRGVVGFLYSFPEKFLFIRTYIKYYTFAADRLQRSVVFHNSTRVSEISSRRYSFMAKRFGNILNRVLYSLFLDYGI